MHMHTLAHIFGLTSASGPWYLFWSGIGSDISEIALFGALLGLLRKHNCEVHGCWRLGRHTTSGGHNVCHIHNPAGKVTSQAVIDAAQESE
jgi:hypothetical protein